MKTLLLITATLLAGCTTVQYIDPQPTVVITGGYRTLVSAPNIVRAQMREKVKGFLTGCVNTAVTAERRLGRLPRRLEIEGFCAGEAVNNFSWLAGAEDWELREIRENFEISLDRIDWRK